MVPKNLDRNRKVSYVKVKFSGARLSRSSRNLFTTRISGVNTGSGHNLLHSTTFLYTIRPIVEDRIVYGLILKINGLVSLFEMFSSYLVNGYFFVCDLIATNCLLLRWICLGHKKTEVDSIIL